MTAPVTIVGGGLAGCEAAWQLARRGIPSRLFEMRPLRETEAHKTDRLAELVCSNSFRSDAIESAVGLLKEEMRCLGSVVMEAADGARVPAGAALAVDRERFADEITRRIESSPEIEVVRQEITDVPSGPTIIATGPLTSQPLYERLESVFGRQHLYFYDAISPIVTSDSIDFDKAFRASRYGRGGDDYVNCPLDRESYERFVDEILVARKVPTRDFEQCVVFEGCMPIEELARRGRDTLAFGPMRPVGLTDPRTGRRPHAVVQLRQDNREGTLYSMVGFQTKMAWPEQRRVFRMIPGLERAEFVRLGSLHRNTFFQSPAILRPTLQFRGRDDLYFAGQIIGVEGYVESAAAGLVAGINVARGVEGLAPVVAPRTTSLGAVLAYVTEPSRRDFQPMNTNYGLFPTLPGRLRGREKKRAQAMRAREELTRWMAEHELVEAEAFAPGLEPASA